MNLQLDSAHPKPKKKNKKPRVKKEDDNESVQSQEDLSRNARRRQRQRKKKKSDSTETTCKSDGIDSVEILKLMLSLHKGQGNIKDLDSKISEKFTDVDMLKWFKESKLFTVFCNDVTGQPEIVSVFIKDARLCFNYKAEKNPCTGMLKDDKPCPFLHLCRDHVRGNCPKGKCTIAHNMTTKHNGVLKKKLGIGKLSKDDALLAVRCSVPMVCEEYNTMGKCSQAILGRCLQFHVCDDFILGKCQDEECPRRHEFKDARRLSEYRIDKLPNTTKARLLIPLTTQGNELEDAGEGSVGVLSRTESLASLSGSSDYTIDLSDVDDDDDDDDDDVDSEENEGEEENVEAYHSYHQDRYLGKSDLSQGEMVSESYEEGYVYEETESEKIPEPHIEFEPEQVEYPAKLRKHKPEPHEEFEPEPEEYAAEPQDEYHDEASESYQEYREVRSLCYVYML